MFGAANNEYLKTTQMKEVDIYKNITGDYRAPSAIMLNSLAIDMNHGREQISVTITRGKRNKKEVRVVTKDSLLETIKTNVPDDLLRAIVDFSLSKIQSLQAPRKRKIRHPAKKSINN